MMDADGEPIPYEDSEDFCQAAEDVAMALAGGWLDEIEGMVAKGP